MTLQREKQLLTEVRDMAALDKTSMSERYKIPVDGADDYFRIKCVAVLDTVIDGLDEEIEFQERQKHYKGIVDDMKNPPCGA